MAWFFDAQQTFISAFTDADPSWHCINKTDWSCTSAVSPCSLPEGSWSWDQPKHASVISEWSLQCSPPALVGLPASSFFMGCLVGGLSLATLADSRLGRKKMLVFTCFTVSITAGLAAVSPNVWVYSALRFICGIGRATVGTSALVLSTELVGKRWRDRVSVIGFVLFTSGFLSLPAIAYFNRGSSWRNIYLWTSIPSFCYIILICFLVNESPRWLFVRGRKNEAIDTLKSIAKSNGYFINTSFSNLHIAEEKWNVDLYSALRILYQKKWAFKRLTTVMIVGFGVGMVYYGMPLNLANLGSNLYLSVTINALVELPSTLIALFLIDRISRIHSILILTAISGITSIACVLLAAGGWKMAMEVVSYFSACTAFTLLLIYSIELFPTSVRNSAISMVRQALVFGGVFAPLLVAEGRKRRFLSFGVFGLVIACCGMFVSSLPETRGRGLTDTMEEEECKEIASSSYMNP
ncbi:uncharacterized protein A4U43_C03F10780 [Asparagus officinalis]|uniref:H(+)/Pi cotransporter n=2 Tax=Asparagus officinalis TaxID=4686 RepID=A0A5P1FE12_ASPOF|nr:uncharacterized protein A4U43_C03F10780 [Asparagus officinalis]